MSTDSATQHRTTTHAHPRRGHRGTRARNTSTEHAPRLPDATRPHDAADARGRCRPRPGTGPQEPARRLICMGTPTPGRPRPASLRPGRGRTLLPGPGPGPGRGAPPPVTSGPTVRRLRLSPQTPPPPSRRPDRPRGPWDTGTSRCCVGPEPQRGQQREGTRSGRPSPAQHRAVPVSQGPREGGGGVCGERRRRLEPARRRRPRRAVGPDVTGGGAPRPGPGPGPGRSVLPRPGRSEAGRGRPGVGVPMQMRRRAGSWGPVPGQGRRRPRASAASCGRVASGRRGARVAACSARVFRGGRVVGARKYEHRLRNTTPHNNARAPTTRPPRNTRAEHEHGTRPDTRPAPARRHAPARRRGRPWPLPTPTGNGPPGARAAPHLHGHAHAPPAPPRRPR
ncbi:proline-rich protein 2-like [Falco peregrinus]|uniref:proline-rich protein 2-like n=1 Tax=Falco peregrinus TaxID=8954 RepID=UPI002478EE60|nr:proline-rich protein 2-like [Falco peregrinus]